MGRQILAAYGALVATAIALGSTAIGAEVPSLQSQLLADAADGQLDRHSWITAALVAGGIDQPRALDHLQQRYEQLRHQLLAARNAPSPGVAGDLGRQLANRHAQGTALLEWMHQEVLTGKYRRECSNVADSLERGDYNCVSSAVLYQALAEELAIKCRIVERPEHAWIEWLSPQGPRTIETTSATGVLNPQFAAPHGGQDAAPRALSPVESLAMIYFNRGTIHFERGELPSAIAANLVALQIDPAREGARHNLLAAINNESVELCRRNQFDAALKLLDCGLALSPGESSLLANRRLAQQQRERRLPAANLTGGGL